MNTGRYSIRLRNINLFLVDYDIYSALSTQSSLANCNFPLKKIKLESYQNIDVLNGEMKHCHSAATAAAGGQESVTNSEFKLLFFGTEDPEFPLFQD